MNMILQCLQSSVESPLTISPGVGQLHQMAVLVLVFLKSLRSDFQMTAKFTLPSILSKTPPHTHTFTASFVAFCIPCDSHSDWNGANLKVVSIFISLMAKDIQHLQIAKVYTGGKTASSINDAQNLCFNIQSNMVDPSLSTCINQLQRIKDLNIRPDVLRLLGKKNRGALQPVGAGKDFLNETPLAQEKRPMINKCALMKLTSCCRAEETMG